jgi:hypothetical protein
MNISELQTGDIIAKHNETGFLPKGIQFFMKRWAKKRYGKEPDKYYNHTMTIVWNYGKPYVAEAIGKGYVIRKLKLNIPKNAIVFRLKQPLKMQEQSNLIDKANEMAYGNIEYEVVNFLWWMPYILSNGKIDLSPKNKEKKVFCFEASAILLNAARKLFEKPDKVTTVDLQFDERFEQLFIDD